MELERVVYLLGAGFSAPLGIPVMSTFVEKSKDLRAGFRGHAKDEFRHFDDVLKTIRELAVAKNYFNADLSNIEEILSILEMRQQLTGERTAESFKRYIADTVKAWTPGVPERTRPSGSAEVFGNPDKKNRIWNYHHFVAVLFGLRVTWRQMDTEGSSYWGPWLTHDADYRHCYDVITLNYDTVLENAGQFLQQQCASDGPVQFIKTQAGEAQQRSEARDSTRPWRRPSLIKLHGSAEDHTQIVPPTWRKSVHDHMQRPWESAYELLREANHLRIVGYSLPESDAYVRYLLKSALIESKHLKTLDVLCIDGEGGAVQKRFSEFLCFKGWRFARDGDVLKYLDAGWREVRSIRANGSDAPPDFSLDFEARTADYLANAQTR